ncbi:MAG TPA: FAD-linked oxidase C-terminal domain-containing protein [Phycisphaerales bacterium]|nr:FAD-linked oxidase C-terminal domain-containing protein [Phycisphaerales bacterium]
MHLPVLPRAAADEGGALRGLANAIEGEVRLGVHDRLLYATDASLYQVEPLAVVIPVSVEDAARAIAYCAAHRLPVLPRGGGTSLAGQCTNRAVVIDLSPNCRSWSRLDPRARTIDAQPGATIDDLNDAIAPSGLFFAPDPATSRQATVGGCIGNNAAGSRSIMYGRTSESIVSIDACLASGETVRFAGGSARGDARVAAITKAVVGTVRAHASAIRERFPRTVRRNAGYGLDMVLAQLDRGVDETDVDLAPVLCGSEGTLAVTLGATLRLHERPRARSLAVASFASVDDAIAAVIPILATKPSAVELLDDMVIGLARANAEYRRYVELLPGGGAVSAVLYVEYSGPSREAVAERVGGLRRVLPAGTPLEVHTDAAAMMNAWKLRKAGEPLLHGVPGHRKPITFVEDNAIPVENLAEFVRELRGIVESHGTRAAFWAHASVGVLHVRPLLDIHDTADRERMMDIAVKTADLARRLGGVMSGEHGDGRVRGPLLERFFGPELMEAFKAVKRAFDPENLLNPGNIVDIGGDSPRPLETMTQRLRVEPAQGRRLTFPPELKTYFDYDDQHGFDGAVEMCNGAGVCRKKQGGTMCPSYMATLDERHSTRGRGNALRLAITGQGSVAEGTAGGVWSDPGAIETLRLCLSCKACKTECPSNVDVARLKAEYTAQRFAREGAPLAARLMGAIRSLNRAGSIMPAVANRLAALRPSRAIARRVLNIDERRSLPPFARSLASSWSPPGGTAPARPRVALFGDCFTMFNEPGIGLATKSLFEACGYDVVLADAGCCGRAKISLGLLPRAIKEIDTTLHRLSPLAADANVRAILVAEPSCLSAIKDDWLKLKLRTPLAVRQALAAKAALPEQFLDEAWDKHPTRPAFEPGARDAILHAHCHQKALWGAETSARALRRVFGESLRVLDSGCCGMAGAFGYTADRFDLSMKIGELVLLPAARAAAGDAAICAPGTSCRHQIHDGAGRRAVHPIEAIASALANAKAAR